MPYLFVVRDRETSPCRTQPLPDKHAKPHGYQPCKAQAFGGRAVTLGDGLKPMETCDTMPDGPVAG